MKYSLRSLMLVVTFIAILLGIRVEYLRRWAAFHEREAAKIKSKVVLLSVEFDFLIWDGQDSQLHDYHQRLATEYRAVCRPWNFVKKRAPIGETELERMTTSLLPSRSSTP